MKGMKTAIWLLAFGSMAVLAAGAGAAKDPIRLLLLDGQNNHDWKATTPVLRDMLLASGRFSVDILTAPPKDAPREAWGSFRPDFSKYKVVLSNYNGQLWPAECQAAFEKYMREGGGLVIYHAANNAFLEWSEWARMVGLLWAPATYGDRVTVDREGKVIRTPKGEGPGAGHGPQHAYEVILRDIKHPIMRGLPLKWVHAKDELYHGQRGPAQNIHVLLTAFSSPTQKGTSTNEPMVFIVPYGKGRVFVNLLGHDQVSVAHSGCSALMVRGAEWAATGKVTIPAPRIHLNKK